MLIHLCYISMPSLLLLLLLSYNLFIYSMESALFVPSGTMSNLLAALVHCHARGSEMIVGSESHMYYYEQGNVAQFGGIHSRAIPNEIDGTLKLENIEKAIRNHHDIHQPITRLVCVENTQNRYGYYSHHD